MLYCRSMAEPTIVPRSSHTISRRDIDPGALKVLYRLHEHNYIAYLVGGSVRDLLLESPAEGLRHRDVGASASGQEALSQLLDHRPALPPRARQVRHADDRGRDVPAAGRLDGSHRRSGDRRRARGRGEEPVMDPSTVVEALDPDTSGPTLKRPPRSIGATPPDGISRERSPDSTRQHLRHAGRGRVPARLHRQRALLRHRHLLDHRLRRRPRGPRGPADPLHRRSGGPVPRRSGPHAARRRARRRGSSSRSISRSSMRSPSIATRSRAARRPGCSRSTTRSCDPATPRKRCGSCARQS